MIMTYNKRLSVIVILLTIILLFQNCDEREPNRYYIPEIVKEYGNFREGSYWIYAVDSIENEDSVWVSKYNAWQYEQFVDKKIVNIFENIQIDCESNRNIKDHIVMEAEYKLNFLGFGEEDNNYNIRYGIPFHYKNTFMPRPDSGDSIIFYDSYNVYDNDFETVLYKKENRPIMDLSDNSKTYDTLEYWIAKNVGVIKKITRNEYENHTYYLKRYHVVQD